MAIASYQTADTSRHPRLFLAVSLAIGFFIGALGLEATARLVVDDGMHFDLEMWKYARTLKKVSPNPDIGHEHRPNSSGVFMGVPVAINSIGLRDREYGPKASGTTRILMLGDSLTFGWGVREEDTPSKLLETSLNGGDSDRHYEVVNSGVGNYNTAMQVSYFFDKGRALEPDVVILNYFINDAESTPRRKTDGGWFREHSYAYVTILSAVDLIARQYFGKSDWKAYYSKLYGENQPGWRDARAAIERLARHCEDSGIELVVVNYPELHELAPYPFEAVTEDVEQTASDADIHFLDLLPSISDKVPETLWVSSNDAHPNRSANIRFAEAISNFLRQDLPDHFDPMRRQPDALQKTESSVNASDVLP